MMDTLLWTVMAPLISKDCVAQKQTANSTAWEDLKLKFDGSLAPHVPCLTKIPDSLNHSSHIWDGFLGVMLRGTRAWVVFASVIYLCKNWKSPFKVQSHSQINTFQSETCQLDLQKTKISTSISPKGRVSCLLPDQNLPASSDWRLLFTFSFPYPISIDKWKI
jgi:hypothetical protein